ncbi:MULTISPECIES: hypoxanthine-guanine phosphoribosyltransferase [unclassified Oceanobacter]|jgi:hypoxanthine phosphoribosyltransferase|uniref:hypoxanthine-guanine phosphoribosyltransferase n=1 Tax=unclassified Oceanobacter TaxID=2620260 RepID=UPI0026E1B0AE|nr:MULTISPECIES: hypoxanthine-guanine phosphoribosyltransferase [unclassified Oceanobacter]MDO6681227.1 hypoxanthine-guanine phosphoribosyltransferase [Oceanobacter sp. 5_MG-2023]MDP2504210.1 hypoxanthine-guanine phosphoribosyltransferase [Oceanobacter sp. 3_MG-2023]MDP2546649.1 hypoxanthine-guanine phosphoribosyltransferase [Oceanobacter sp. 4_MG-2023]MDP2608611.1 hypoxanthine-guanine phosphoribosyltransferase [Oceanobacter sp. 1_MG-2023]MDP2611627.1 hypoxanthine-guanine phosphoribosyltransfe
MSETLTKDQLDTVLQEADLLKTPEQVDDAINQLAADLTERLQDTVPVVYTIMNGGLVLAGRLLPRLPFALEVGYMHATRYRGDVTGSTELQWQAPPSIPMTDRTVLILDDIFDEGHTLAAVVEACRQQGAKEVLTAVLVDKRHDRKTDELTVDYAGMEVEDRYVFGCGMDYRGFWRNLPGIYAVKGL